MLTKHPRADAARGVWGTILIVIGVSGSGKTTVGKLLAARLGAEFSDADDFHSAANKAKMRAGIALTDDDRRDVKSFGWVAHGCALSPRLYGCGRGVNAQTEG